MREMTLGQFERLVERMWKAFERYEKVVEYRDDESHEIIKGQAEYDKYRVLRNEVESHACTFHASVPVKYPD
jgi:hypothetical protein